MNEGKMGGTEEMAGISSQLGEAEFNERADY